MYIKGLKYLRGCKYFMGLIYGYKDKMYGCMDICIYEYIWIHGYMNIYIYNSGVSCISGEASISAVLSISWVSHIWRFEYIDRWIHGYVDI